MRLLKKGICLSLVLALVVGSILGLTGYYDKEYAVAAEKSKYGQTLLEFKTNTSYAIANINSKDAMEENGETVDQWYDFAGINFRWCIEGTKTDGYRIISRESGKCIVASSDEDNAKISLVDVNKEADNQLWTITVDGTNCTIQNKDNQMYLSILNDDEADGGVAVVTKDKKLSSLWNIKASVYSGEPEYPTSAPKGSKTVKLTRQSLINKTDIELVFNRDVKYCKNVEDYVVTVNGKTIKNVSIVAYFDKMVTLHLPKAVKNVKKDKIKVKCVKNIIRDKKDNYINSKTVYQVTYKPYYTKFYTGKSGIKIKSCSLVSKSVLKYVSGVIDIMTEKHPEVQKAMVKAGADIAIFPKEQNIYYIPEFRNCYSPNALDVEGFGGTTSCPTTAIGEGNITRDASATLYPDNNLLAHEFGHAFHLVGIITADPALYQEIHDTYEKVKAAGLWPHTYMISNEFEYFGQLSAMWFEGLDESSDGTFNGNIGPVNTREEVKKYDIDSYNLVKKIYSEDSYFSSPWAKEDVKDNFNIDGTPKK